MWFSVIIIYSLFLYSKYRKGYFYLSKPKRSSPNGDSIYEEDHRHSLNHTLSLGNIYQKND
ncbi:hypothetical protein EDB73_101351 [Vibrio crassostreae]|nr:hypothetical protein EDB73_101351 [Vibrio crassostreae]